MRYNFKIYNSLNNIKNKIIILNLVIFLLCISECSVCALSFNTLHTCIFQLFSAPSDHGPWSPRVCAPAKWAPPRNGLCPDSFCVNLRFILVAPVKSDASLTEARQKAPNCLIYMQIFLHSPMPANSALLPGKMRGPNWASGSKAPLILMPCFQIRFFIPLCSEAQWLVSVKTAHFSFSFSWKL